jgi:dolichol-phosphate mannosyltransferase
VEHSVRLVGTEMADRHSPRTPRRQHEPLDPEALPSSANRTAIDLTVVVPTYNERPNVEQMCACLRRALDGLSWEAIFVDDDSLDGTAGVVREIGRTDPRIRCIRRVNRRGLAGACIEGMLAAQGPIVAVIDGDLQHDATTLRALLAQIHGGADIAIASRFCPGASLGGFAAGRSRMSRIANALCRLVPGVTTTDPMSGFFMVRQAAIEPLAQGVSTAGFKLLLDILATARGTLRVAEVPFHFGARRAGESKLDGRVLFDFVSLLVEKSTGGVIPGRFFGYAAVGLLGILAHLAVLRAALGFAMSFLDAQLLATAAAMTFNFLLNNSLTYRDRRLRGRAMLTGLLEFYAICSIGAVANVGVASWVFWGLTQWSWAGLAGSMIGSVWNYGMSSLLVWNRRT